METTGVTIRDHINGKLFPATCLAWVFILLLLILLWGEHGRHVLSWVVFLPFLGFAGCMLYTIFGIRCSVCRGRISQLVYLPGGGIFRLSRRVKFCPFCGVDLDREVGASEEERKHREGGEDVLPA